ncbi:MAG TPA: hypothetical protein VFB22_02650 [Candidatus Baltobacteraceae bacterium]|nr:hypothetical protein [Candidatus Baltobacteraceae bacterium]
MPPVSGCRSLRVRAAASALVAACACALLVAPRFANAQSVAAAPLPTIGRTHAKGFCDMVRDNVAPSVLGLMKTDELVGAGHRGTAKMAHDQITGSPRMMQMDRVYLESVVAAMARNLKLLDKLISDPNRFPKVARTDDDRLAQELQQQLRDARAQQNEALNHLNGVLETMSLSDAKSEVLNQPINHATGPIDGATPLPTTGFMGEAALGAPGPIPDPRDRAQLMTTSGHTIWDQLDAVIEVDQAHIAHAEQVLSPTVVAAATGCQGASTPAPAPAPQR